MKKSSAPNGLTGIKMGPPACIIYSGGVYHLFRPFRKGLSAGIAHFLSSDLLDWQETEPAVYKKIRPFGYGAGSAVLRNGKIFFIYDNTFPLGRQRLSVSRDHNGFEEYPLPILKGRTTLKDPRVFYSNGRYYMLLCQNMKTPKILLFTSDNLMNWHFKEILLHGEKGLDFRYQSIVCLGGKNYIIFTKINKKPKEEKTFACRCALDIDNRYFSLDGEKLPLEGLYCPRTAALLDGRIILIGNADKSSGNMLTPRELYYSEGLCQRPVREIFEKRKEFQELCGLTIDTAEYKVFPGDKEILIDINLSLCEKLEIAFGNDTAVSVDKEKISLTYRMPGEKAEYLLSDFVHRDKVSLDILIRGALLEVFVKDSHIALSAAVPEDTGGLIKINADGTAVLNITVYKLD